MEKRENVSKLTLGIYLKGPSNSKKDIEMKDFDPFLLRKVVFSSNFTLKYFFSLLAFFQILA